MSTRTLPTLDLRKPVVRPGDFKTAIWTQYMNCVNSLNTLESESIGYKDMQTFSSFSALDKFENNVEILLAMCDGYDLFDDDFRKKVQDNFKSTVKFAEITRLFKRKVFAEQTEDGGHV